VIGEFAAVVTVKAEFADELLVSGLALRLLRDVLEDGGIGKHRSSTQYPVLSTYLLVLGIKITLVLTLPILIYRYQVSLPDFGGQAFRARRIIAIWPVW